MLSVSRPEFLVATVPFMQSAETVGSGLGDGATVSAGVASVVAAAVWVAVGVSAIVGTGVAASVGAMVSGGTGVATGVGPAASVGTGVLAGAVVPADEPLRAAAWARDHDGAIARQWNLVRILGSPLGRMLCRTLFGAHSAIPRPSVPPMSRNPRFPEPRDE